MFELLNPLYFYIGGALGVVIPLVLHLIQRSRTVRMPFSTLRFLKLAQKKSSSRLKIEHFLLWLIRTLMLVFLSLAFAILMLREKMLGNWFGQAARDVAIVIDGSYSMDYNLGRRTVWQDAIESAVAVLEGLTERDRFCIYIAGDHVTPLIEQLSGNREEAISRLKALMFSQGSSQLAPAIMDANATLAEVKERRPREIFVITDTQALPWRGFGSGDASPKDGDGGGKGKKESKSPAAKKGAEPAEEDAEGKKVAAMGVWDPTKIDAQTVCFVALLGASAPENAAAVDIALDPPLIMKNFASKATVKILCSGATKNTVATLFVDDKEIGSQSVAFETNRFGETTFIVPPLAAGRHAARIKLPDDNLMLDNVFYFLLKAEDQFPTLCVGTRDDTLFLRAALTAGLGTKGTVEADWVEPASLSQKNLQSYACVFLCNAVPIGAEDMTALERFVDAGGLLVMFPGERATAADYQSWGCLPGMPASVDPVPQAERRQLLNWDAPNHAILKSLTIGEAALTVNARKRLAWSGFEKDAERLISCGGDHPFLVGRPRGRGYVLLFAVAADRSWSDFPLSPFYLPIMRQIVLFGAGVGSYAQYVWCTSSLPLEPYLPDATRETILTNPDGENVPIRSTTEDGKTVLRVEDLNKAGVYRTGGGAGGESAPALAVNMRRDESDLSPVNPADVEGLLGLKHVYVARDKEQLLTQVKDSRVGRTFAEELLWLVLVLGVIEFFYANRLLKSAPSLSDTLEIETSGKMQKDHTE